METQDIFDVTAIREVYEIRVARESDHDALVQFIDEHWRRGHIFTVSRVLFDWQHLDRARGAYNFVIGVEIRTGALHGVLGFIPLSQFDAEIDYRRLCWMAIWKVQDAARGHRLGRRLLSYLENAARPDTLSTVAASSMTLPMYEALGYQIGRLNHHFILNPEKASFRLVVVGKAGSSQTELARASDTLARLDCLSEAELTNDTAHCFLTQDDLPRKTPRYLINRYLRHPLYRYQAYGIRHGATTVGIVITRVCAHDGARAIRIVDFIGPSRALRGLQDEWIRLLTTVDAEYLDFYNAGIDGNDLLASGFTRREENDDFVIPNYFEPFAKENVEIDYMISTPLGTPYRIVKGDSDQDRPNVIPERSS